MATLEFRRIDPEANCFRRYRLTDRPNLFGGIDLIAEWGRIGWRSRSKVESFETPDALARRRAELLGTRRRRGYELVAVTEDSSHPASLERVVRALLG